MKKILFAVLAATLLSSLSACMVAPAYDPYGGPGVTVVAPVPHYYNYREPHRHRHYRDRGHGRW